MNQPKQRDWVDEFNSERESMEAVEEYHSALGKAIDSWSKGKHISMTLYTELLEDGYDVPRLEARYFVY